MHEGCIRIGELEARGEEADENGLGAVYNIGRAPRSLGLFFLICLPLQQ